MENSDLMIVWAVVISRFLLPLAIPRYPLPAIIACMILDAADYEIFNFFTHLPIERLVIYQGYDKSLDIYYQTIAYISTFRNWTNPFAFKLDRFLFYYRLVGVALFKLTEIRALLFIFPNAFEYFFIAYEAFRMRQDPRRLTKRKLIEVAAFICIYIKIPQELWIHIVQPNYPDLFTDYPWTILIAIVWFAGIASFAWWLLRKKQDGREVSSAVNPVPANLELRDEKRNMTSKSDRLIDDTLIEKIILISLLSIVFAQVLPGLRASNIQIAMGVVSFIVINVALSHWISYRGKGLTYVLEEFSIMVLVNFSLIIAADYLLPRIDGSIDVIYTMFFVLMLAVNVVLYDQYRQVYVQRLEAANNKAE